MATTYWDYIRVEELLALQQGREQDATPPSRHEVVFITVHQVYELWFKLVIAELDALRGLFALDRVPERQMAEAARALDRVRTIMLQAESHFDVVESIDTRDYLEFRDKLFPASGFQSAQMREMEILLGLPDEERVGFGSDQGYLKALRDADGKPSVASERVEARREDGPSLCAAFEEWLHRTPIRGSMPESEGDAETVDAFIDDYLKQHAMCARRLVEEIAAASGGHADDHHLRSRYETEVQAAADFLRADDARRRRIRAAAIFIECYRELPLLTWPSQVIDKVVAMEQAMVRFRQRHARMVERVIGRRLGTGGSSGVDYLDDTARYRVFKDLWALPTLLIPTADLPPLADTAPYEFKATY